MANKEFLENAFPSLHEDLVPIENYSNLEPLTIPEAIIQLLPDDDGNTQVVVGIDTEYNIEVSSYGHVTSHSHMAIIQIACGKHIFVLQVRQMAASGCLPSSLKTLPLALIPLPTPLTPETPFGTPVNLFGQDKSCLITQGLFSFLSNGPAYEDIHLTSSCCIITVTGIYVPGAVISLHKKQLLLTFGSLAFNLVCLHSCISVSAIPPLAFTPESASHNSAVETAPTTPDSASPDSIDGVSTAIGIGMLVLDTADSPQEHPVLSTLSNFEVDAESNLQGD
ncbi:hypothetical protein GYMLUDRAFT_240832 [Collybiopsis luxurians FD-317 M1]|nr:hypothetical protein GYMLUDRAFT_240832 [Collybiopsis luxurians FD-317 M1]